MSMVSQHKLVSSWGLQKGRSAPSRGPAHGFGRSLVCGQYC